MMRISSFSSPDYELEKPAIQSRFIEWHCRAIQHFHITFITKISHRKRVESTIYPYAVLHYEIEY